MATPVFDVATGNGGRSTGTSAALNHKAAVLIIISIGYEGATSPNSVTVGGNNASAVSSSKVSNGTSNSMELFYYWAAGAANDTVAVGFASTTIHGWSAASYTGVNSNLALGISGANTASGSGASPRTSAVTITFGRSDSLIFAGCSSKDGATGSGAIAIAPANSETERDEHGYAGAASRTALQEQIEDYSTSAANHNCQATHTKAGRTLGWVASGISLNPAPPVDTSAMFMMFPQGRG